MTCPARDILPTGWQRVGRTRPREAASQSRLAVRRTEERQMLQNAVSETLTAQNGV
jgi:hypothetical protein